MIEIRVDKILNGHSRTFYWLAKETGISHTTLWRLKKGKALGMSLDTLAAGYAAAGRYPEAVRAAEKALELVQAVSAQDAPAVAERLMLYQQGKPYREPVRPAAR